MIEKSITLAPVATLAQFAKVQQLAEEIWPVTFGDILSNEQIEYMLSMMYASEVFEREIEAGVIWKLLQNKEQDIIGFVSWSVKPDRIAQLHKVYLRVSSQGQGLGAQTIALVKENCRQEGCKTLQLNVNKNNIKAIRCYQRNGFDIVRTEKNDIGSGFVMDDYVMQCRL